MKLFKNKKGNMQELIVSMICCLIIVVVVVFAFTFYGDVAD